ncbi:MAG TPA: glycosyltransferase family 4 protein, partial [Bryobacteraceae bacterium]|nr:glycosyltransferase family 4 protein [Bryobacteraceae bacterium]
PQFFPFGPASWNPDPQAADLVRSSAGIVAIGEHMAGYIKSHLGRDPAVIHPPIYGDPPYPRFGNFDEGWILMINPSAVKGIRIFLALADRFPDYTFAALTGWATTTDDRVELAHRPNVVVLETVPRIDDVLAKSRLLLMPSLWYEGFGLIAMEAMLRGVPVISSDSGGLMEAKQGTGFVVPVRPIQRYEPHFDETHMPRPLEPAQDIEPWVQALQKLLTQKDAYVLEADRSRQVATEFVSKLKASDFEAYLALLQPSPDSGSAALPGTNSDARLSGLSPAKRALLLQKLRERAKG